MLLWQVKWNRAHEKFSNMISCITTTTNKSKRQSEREVHTGNRVSNITFSWTRKYWLQEWEWSLKVLFTLWTCLFTNRSMWTGEAKEANTACTVLKYERWKYSSEVSREMLSCSYLLVEHYLGLGFDLLPVVCDWVASLNTDPGMVSYPERLFLISASNWYLLLENKATEMK